MSEILLCINYEKGNKIKYNKNVFNPSQLMLNNSSFIPYALSFTLYA